MNSPEGLSGDNLLRFIHTPYSVILKFVLCCVDNGLEFIFGFKISYERRGPLPYRTSVCTRHLVALSSFY